MWSTPSACKSETCLVRRHRPGGRGPLRRRANLNHAITFPHLRDEPNRRQSYPENSGPWNGGSAPLDRSILGNYLDRTVEVGQHHAILREVSKLHFGSSPNGLILRTHYANLTALDQPICDLGPASPHATPRSRRAAAIGADSRTVAGLGSELSQTGASLPDTAVSCLGYGWF